jgi:hypothetical protein
VRGQFLLLIALGLAGCGDSPSYPADWPALRPGATRIGKATCPDLTGTYALTRTVPTHGAKRRGKFVWLTQFLTVNANLIGETNQARSIPPPPKMRLEGPTPAGLRVIFYDKSDTVVTDRTIKAGVAFVCRGAWIADAKPTHTRAAPQHFYARDADGRLIGHKAYSAWGLTLLLGVFPVPVYVNDHEWWRIEPAR